MGLKRNVAFGMTIMFVAALSVSAQDKPDFTGTWTRSDTSATFSYVQRVAQKGDEITVQIDSRSSAGTMGGVYRGEHSYTIGGPLESTKDRDGRVRSVAVSWDGPRLVFLRTTTEGANVTTERESWSLSADKTQLTKDRVTTDWRGTSSERRVFQRNDAFRPFDAARTAAELRPIPCVPVDVPRHVHHDGHHENESGSAYEQ